MPEASEGVNKAVFEVVPDLEKLTPSGSGTRPITLVAGSFPSVRLYLHAGVEALVRCLISPVLDFGNSIGRENSNIEIRNPKQYQNSNVQNSIQSGTGPQFFLFGDSYRVPLNLFRVSIFAFRISASLGNGSNRKHSSRISNCHFWGQNL